MCFFMFFSCRFLCVHGVSLFNNFSSEFSGVILGGVRDYLGVILEEFGKENWSKTRGENPTEPVNQTI